MKNSIHSRPLRTPWRRRWLVLGLLACSFHAPVSAKPIKPTHKHHHHHNHHHHGATHHRHTHKSSRHGAAKSPLSPVAEARLYREVGKASWYGIEFHGRRTANGESFDRREFTGAHRTLPFGTVVRVTNLRNGRSALVRINDRGPFAGNRIIDLSYAAAKQIGITTRGVAKVRIEQVAPAELAKDDHLRKRRS